MVGVVRNIIITIYFFMRVSLHAQGAQLPPQISVSFPASTIYETDDIKGVITIICTPDQKVDAASFKISGVPLPVELLKSSEKERVPEGLVVSKYQFIVPKKGAGLYLFPAVEAVVGGIKVQSIPVSFEVLQTVSSQALTLEAKLGSVPPFYPGQKILFQYRIYFQEPIELIHEELPLLFVSGFRNNGSPKITSYIQGSDTVQQISQEAVCIAPGTFYIKPSRIEGYIYKVGPTGERIRDSSLIRADADGFSVTVEAFPEKGRPPSFNGILGQFDWKARLVSSNAVSVGDLITVEVVASGAGELDTAALPDIAKQPGFNSFRFSDIPSIGKVEGSTKRFTVEMRPLSQDVVTIPSMEFSSFDPLSQSYIVRRTKPIPFTIKRSGSSSGEIGQELPQETVERMEIYGNMPITQKEVEISNIKPVIILVVVLVLSALCVLQLLLKKIIGVSKEKILQSRDLFYQALQSKNKPDVACSFIQRALLLRLYEVSYTHVLAKVPEDLSEEGIEGEIRRFLITIDQKRFAGLELDTEIKEIIKEASELYHRLGQHT